MGDVANSGLQFQQSGQTANPSKMPAASTEDGATPGEGIEQEQKPLTRAEVLQIVRDELPRMSQSVSDKTVAKVQKMMQTLQKQGVTATADQVAAVVAEMGDAPTSNPEPSKRTPAPVQSDGAQEQPHPLVMAANQLIAKAGLDVERDFTDEEKTFFQEAVDEDDFYTRVKEAVKVKADKRGSPSRVPGISSGSSTTRTGAKGALTDELNDLLKHPTTQNMVRIREVRELLKK